MVPALPAIMTQLYCSLTIRLQLSTLADLEEHKSFMNISLARGKWHGLQCNFGVNIIMKGNYIYTIKGITGFLLM